MASLKVKRLKQETVGNKQEEVETNLGEESLLSKPARHPRPTWGGTPLPWPRLPPIKGGAGPPPLDTQVSIL